MPVQTDPVRFSEVRLVASGRASFSLSLTITNHSIDPMFVTYPLQEYDNVGKRIDPNKIYVFLDRAELSIALMLWPVPLGLDVYRPEVPLLTKVGRNSELRIRLNISSTLRLTYPYKDMDKSGGEIGSARSFESVTLRVGYLPFESITDKSKALALPDGQHLEKPYGEISRAQRVISRRLSSPSPILLVP